MTTKETNLWGIHAGKTGDADRLFFKKDCIAIGWAKMGDLRKAKSKGSGVISCPPTRK